MEHLSVREPVNLDLEVSHRQSFGASYRRPKALEEKIATYMSGKLELPPQPVWVGDPTNWTADPFNDRNWRFQHHTLRWLNPLRWAAFEGDTTAKKEWIRIVRSWLEHNVPAHNAESDFAWRDMVDGNRAIQLSLGAPLVDGADWYVALLKYHRDWLMNPAHIVAKNHGLHQHAGLLVVGATLRDETAVETAVGRMTQQFEMTFDKQGANDEGSVVYHQHNIIWWTQAWQRVENENINLPPGVHDRLRRAADVMASLALPDGSLPQIGDGGRTNLVRGLSDRIDFIATGGKEGSSPGSKSLILDRGYIVTRSGWGETKPLRAESHSLIRYGENLQAHSHHDRGSIHVYSDGQRWLIDSGFHSYQAGEPINRYLKSREAHNLPSIIGLKHDHEAPVELVSSNITDEFEDFTLLDRGYEPDELYRRVIYFREPDCWMVSDKAVSKNQRQIMQNWFVEPGIVPRVRDNGFRLDIRSRTFGLYWLGRHTDLSLRRAAEGTHDAWIGTRWKTLEPSAKITAKSTRSQPHLVTLLASNSPTPLSVVESRLSMDGNILLYVSRGNNRWQITIYGGTLQVKRSSQ